LIRHGATLANLKDETRSSYTDAEMPLAKKGIRQAEEAGKVLAKYFDENEICLGKGAKIWTSSFSRATKTSEILNEFLGIQDVTEVPALIEQSFGRIHYLHEDEVERDLPELYEEYVKLINTIGKFDAKISSFGIESVRDVRDRVIPFTDSLRQAKKEGVTTGIIVAHAISLNVLRGLILGENPEWICKQEYPPNCSIRKIQYGNKNPDRGYIYHC